MSAVFVSERRAPLGGTLVLRKGSNSLNMLRLVLACLVIASHSRTLGGFGSENILGRNSLGAVSVDGFFGISGYLICASALRHTDRSGRWPGIRRYFWDRFLRIFPAFWVCLIVTAVGFGVVGWLSTHSTLAGYWAHPVGPLYYLTSNFYLTTPTYQISGTPSSIPYPLVWDGSLWTLEWEFLCYIGVGALAATGLLIRRSLMLWMDLLAWLLGIIVFFHPLSGHPSAEIAMRFIPIFLTGALMYLFRNEIPDSGLLAIGLTVCGGLRADVRTSGSSEPGLAYGPHSRVSDPVARRTFAAPQDRRDERHQLRHVHLRLPGRPDSGDRRISTLRILAVHVGHRGVHCSTCSSQLVGRRKMGGSKLAPGSPVSVRKHRSNDGIVVNRLTPDSLQRTSV